MDHQNRSSAATPATPGELERNGAGRAAATTGAPKPIYLDPRDIKDSAPRPQRGSWPLWRLIGFRLFLLYALLYVLPFPVSMLTSIRPVRMVADVVAIPAGVPQREMEERFDRWIADNIGPWFRWIDGDSWTRWLNPETWRRYANEGIGEYSRGSREAVLWFGPEVLGTDEVIVQPTGSGDTLHNYVRAALIACIAAAGALLWTLVRFRSRAAPERLHDWLRVLLRYYLASMMLSYGFAKVFPNQFSFPSWNKMATPFGQSSAMGVLWTFIGTSTPYQMFSGAAEVLGGMLLFFRRTTTIGVLVSIAVMTNIAALNLCYDVPVKLPSLTYLAMMGFLLLPDLGRLARFFVLNRGSEAAVLRIPARWGWTRCAAGALKILIVAHLFFTHIEGNYVRWTGRYGTPDPAIVGAYEVTEIVRGANSVPLLVSDRTLWRRLAVTRGATETGRIAVFASFLTMEDKTDRRYGVDEVAHTMFPPANVGPGSRPSSGPTSRAADGGPRGRGPRRGAESRAANPATRPESRPRQAEFRYTQPTPDQIVVEGVVNGVEQKATFQRIDPKSMPLHSRGFSWIQEFPFNR